MSQTIDFGKLGDINHNLNMNFCPQIRDDWIRNIVGNISENSKVIDIGAGNKPYEHLFSHCDYKSHEFASNEDIKDTFRGEGTEKKKHDYTGDITSLPIPDNEFDCVFCTEVFEHIPDPIAAFKELVRICKKGGNIIITAPFTSGSHQQPYHFYSGFSPEFYEYLANKNNVTLEEIKSQGDFFKLMCWMNNLILQFPIHGAERGELDRLRGYLGSYLLTASEIFGDPAGNFLPVSNHFTIGWMVKYKK